MTEYPPTLRLVDTPERGSQPTDLERELTAATPSNERLQELIKPIWRKVKPSLRAQSIRSTLSVEFDDPQYASWVSDFIPDYVWDLVDIAAQRGIDTAIAAMLSRAAAIEECAVWHDKQASAWQDQAHAAYRQIGGSDEAYAAEFRAQHETYTKYRIIHEQSARDLRALLGETAP